MIQLGGLNIADMRVGSHKVVEVRLGSTTVWSASTPPPPTPPEDDSFIPIGLSGMVFRMTSLTSNTLTAGLPLSNNSFSGLSGNMDMLTISGTILGNTSRISLNGCILEVASYDSRYARPTMWDAAYLFDEAAVPLTEATIPTSFTISMPARRGGSGYGSIAMRLINTKGVEYYFDLSQSTGAVSTSFTSVAI